MSEPEKVVAVVGEWVIKAEQRRLTAYATALRYPDYPTVSLADARKAVAVARRVRRQVRRMLPRAALRQRKE